MGDLRDMGEVCDRALRGSIATVGCFRRGSLATPQWSTQTSRAPRCAQPRIESGGIGQVRDREQLAFGVAQQRQALALPRRDAQVLQHVLERMRVAAPGLDDAFAAVAGMHEHDAIEAVRAFQLQPAAVRQGQRSVAVPWLRQSAGNAGLAASACSRSRQLRTVAPCQANNAPASSPAGKHVGFRCGRCHWQAMAAGRVRRSSGAARARVAAAATPAGDCATGSADRRWRPAASACASPSSSRSLGLRAQPGRLRQRSIGVRPAFTQQRQHALAQEIAVETGIGVAGVVDPVQAVRLSVGEQFVAAVFEQRPP